MKLVDFGLKIFGYKRTKVIQLNGKEKTLIIKMHPPIFKLVIFNALEMITDWYRSRILGLNGLVYSEKAAKFAIENPMNKKAKIGYIEVPDCELKKE